MIQGMSATEFPASLTSLRVRYAETDAMGVAHHAVYPVWFEVGRSDLMRAAGLSYAEIEKQGYYLMLTDLGVNYRRAARYEQELTLHTRVEEVRSRTLRFGYDLFGSSGDPVASGHTSHIVTDHNYRPQCLPEHLLVALQGQAGEAQA